MKDCRQFNILILIFQEFSTSNSISDFNSLRPEKAEDDTRDLLTVIFVKENDDVNTESSEEDSNTADYNENGIRNANFNRNEDSTERGSEGRLNFKIIQSRKDYEDASSVLIPSPVILRSSSDSPNFSKIRKDVKKKCIKACRRSYKSICNKFSCSRQVKLSFKRKCRKNCKYEYENYGESRDN